MPYVKSSQAQSHKGDPVIAELFIDKVVTDGKVNPGVDQQGNGLQQCGACASDEGVKEYHRREKYEERGRKRVDLPEILDRVGTHRAKEEHIRANEAQIG